MGMLLLSFALGLSSCYNPKQAEVSQLSRQVMNLHDSVMPKISKVLSLRRHLNKRIETCRDSMQRKQLESLTYGLTRADAEMMNWMRSYQEPKGPDTALTYLQVQYSRIAAIGDLINKSITTAEKYLNENPEN